MRSARSAREEKNSSNTPPYKWDRQRGTAATVRVRLGDPLPGRAHSKPQRMQWGHHWDVERKPQGTPRHWRKHTPGCHLQFEHDCSADAQMITDLSMSNPHAIAPARARP